MADEAHDFSAHVYVAGERFARFCIRCGKPDLRRVRRSRCVPVEPAVAADKIRRKVGVLGRILGGKPEIRDG